MSAPHGGDAVRQRQQGVRMLDDVDDREVVLDEGHGQAGKGKHQHDIERPGCRTRQGDPAGMLPMGANQGQDALHQRDAKGQDERVVTEFRDHCLNGRWKVKREKWKVEGENQALRAVKRTRQSDTIATGRVLHISRFIFHLSRVFTPHGIFKVFVADSTAFLLAAARCSASPTAWAASGGI